jgi:hypothetical protein
MLKTSLPKKHNSLSKYYQLKKKANINILKKILSLEATYDCGKQYESKWR